MADREIAHVKNWFDDKGYGFLRRQDGSDLFCHISATGFLPLKPGQRVSFDVGNNPRTSKMEAKAVAVMD
jgi:CspA family cold shock protein